VEGRGGGWQVKKKGGGGGGVHDDGTAETVFVLTANNVQERTACNNV